MKTIFLSDNRHSRIYYIFCILIVYSFQAKSVDSNTASDIAPLHRLPELEIQELEPAVYQQVKEQQVTINNKLDKYIEAKLLLAQQYELTGQLYQAYGLSEGAKTSYQNSIYLDPQNFTVQYLLGHVLLELNMPNKAVQSFVTAQRINPNYPALWVNLGNTLLQLKRYSESKKAYLNAQALAPDDPSALAGTGQVFLAEKNYYEAIKYFTKAIEITPQANRLYYLLGMAYRGIGDEEKARSYLNMSGKIGIRPNDPIKDNLSSLLAGERVQILKGKNEYFMGQFKKSAQSFQKAIEADPQSARARINLSAALAKLGKYNEARHQLLKAIELAPDNATAHYNLGQLLEHEKMFSVASEHYKKAAALTPEDPVILYDLATLLMQTGNIDAALSYYPKIIELAPNYMPARVDYARALYREKHFQQSIDVLEAAYRLDSTNGVIAHHLARALVMTPSSDLKDGNRALDLAIRVMDAQPTLQHADTLIHAYSETGACGTAEELIQEVINSIDESDPNLPKLRENYKQLILHKTSSGQCND